MIEEQWKPVKGKEEFAEISSDGLIHFFATGKGRYPNDRWTWGSENKKGYLRAKIGGESKGVHQWVYLTFVGKIPKGWDVNHLDENKHNNRVENLEVCSHEKNCNWGSRNEKIVAARKGLYNIKSSKPVEAIDKDTGKVIYTFPSTREAERQGFNQGNISQCCRNCFNRPGNNIYKGFIWRYKE